LNYIIV